MNTLKWERKPLGAIADLCLGKMLDQNKNRGVLFPYLANVNVRWGEFSLDDLRTMRFEPKEMDRYGLKFGDIVMCEGGEPGRCAIWKNQIPGMMIQKALHRIRPNKLLDYRFLFYSFLSIGQSKGFDQYFTGSTIKHLPLEKLAKVEIDIPPIHVQQSIAGILSAYDELIENNQRRIRILEEMARSLYREWFVHFRYPGHESVPLFDSPLGQIPQGWEVKPVPDCIAINPRVTVPRDGEKPFVPMGCLSNDSMLISDIESRSGNSGAKFQNGDTLFARITPCLENGKTGYVQFLPNSQDVAFGSTEFIVLRARTLSPEFVYCLARSNEFRNAAIKSMSGATGRQRVQEKCFDAFLIAQPPRELLDRFTKIVAPSFRLIYSLHHQIENLRRTRDLLLPRLLSGQVVITEIEQGVVYET
jgi:type I restriction enzyme S subunit